MPNDPNDLEQGFALTINQMLTDGQGERLHSFTSLLNTFNYAVQVQNKRPDWSANDFRLFAMALMAMNRLESKGGTAEMHTSHAKEGVV